MNKKNNEIKTDFGFKPVLPNHPFEVPRKNEHLLVIITVAIALFWALIINILILL